MVIGVIPRVELAQQPDPAGEPDDRPSYTTPRDVTLDALPDVETSLGAAAAFTVSRDEARTLQVLAEVHDRNVSEHRIKQTLHPMSTSLTDRRATFVGLKFCEAAGGRITDLFSQDVSLVDPRTSDETSFAKLGAAAARLTREDRWKWAEVETSAGIDCQRIGKLDRLHPHSGDPTEEEAAR